MLVYPAGVTCAETVTVAGSVSDPLSDNVTVPVPFIISSDDCERVPLVAFRETVTGLTGKLPANVTVIVVALVPKGTGSGEAATATVRFIVGATPSNVTVVVPLPVYPADVT